MSQFLIPSRRMKNWDDEMAGTLTWLKEQIEALQVGGGTDPGALQIANNLSDLADAIAARANLGLGTAATSAATAFDASGSAAAAQAFAIQRANHTGTQTSATISDFTEAVQDAVAALLAAGTGVTVSYDDAGNLLTITATGGGGSTDPEVVRDTIGVALQGLGVITVTANDAADTITISSTATQNSTDAALRDRSTHTGTQSLDTTTDSAARLAMTAAERTKLTGIADGATANATDAQLRDRSTHTGTQDISTIVNLQTSLDAKVDDAEKGAASGVATLGADSLLPVAQLGGSRVIVLAAADPVPAGTVAGTVILRTA